ncbi:PREDICTED: bifunctional heparan sulfate N-deacetylase/N-sulfotransferase 4-like [Acropora digitifera]|uniref:bifunctional heparan sulfate N-deacetylase/N-sulfotransferase 4-like n=1 Tax=Acropora digitifera TaxID=70779 RepID=UPI00077AC25F|nr:PREDICTED: bifunctional heparan sulfate N-deacetylase/N-sulfotransferase 4-like [Acropora digitifera]
MRVFRRAKRLRFPRNLCLIIIPVGWLMIFITLSLYNEHDNAVHRGKVLANELTQTTWRTTFPVPSSKLADSVLSSIQHGNKTFKVQKNILVLQRAWVKEGSKLAHHVTRFLDGLRVPYFFREADDKVFTLLKEDLKAEVTVGRYSVLVFVNVKTYLDLKPNARQIVNLYCKKFSVGMLYFISNHVGYIPEFLFEVVRPLKERQILDVEVNGESKLLSVTRRGGSVIKPNIPKGQGTRWSFLRYDPEKVPYETVEYATNRRRRRKRDLETAVTEKACIILDNGRKDGIKRVFFGGGFPFFLHTMLFMDSLEYLSPVSPIAFSRQRYLQIDVDDIFVAKSGIRMKKKDVLEMISEQDRLKQKIPGFKFNLGFSGRGFKQGDDEEDEGDMALIKYADKFTWFGHLYDHEQPHKRTYAEIVKSLKKNEEFAKMTFETNYSLDRSSERSVSRSYPEESVLQVLPRQTCGLFTTTNFFHEIKGGKKALDRSIDGGELFETVLRNPVSVVMTHLTNYGNDRLALYTVSRLVNFVHRWTNLELKYASPTELADIYFSLFPRNTAPLWLSPCDDSRHLQIWANHKSCSRLPSFLVIGPPFGGLNLLAKLLKLHPDLLPISRINNSTLGTQFFNTDNYLKGLDWYMDFFPRPTRPEQQMSFEVSDQYFTDRNSPFLASNLLKSVTILIVVEDPVKRAFYHYQHLKYVEGLELPSFDDLIMSKSDSYLTDLRGIILEAGHYSEHIARWMKYYNAKQMSIISTDDLVSRPISAMNSIQGAIRIETRQDYSEVLRFNEVSGQYCLKSSTNATECLTLNESRAVAISPRTEQYLNGYYAKHNQNLLRMNQKIEFPLPKWIHG